MAFKEKMKKIGRSIKNFCKEHAVEIAAVGAGLAATGAGCYAIYKIEYDSWEKTQKLIGEVNDDLAKDKAAWNEDWTEQALAFDLDTHQPYGLEDETGNYVDPLNGNCFIIAGPNSLYNDDSSDVKIYVMDNDGWYHLMPDDHRAS